MRLTAFIALTVFHLVVSALFGVFFVGIALAAVDGNVSGTAMRTLWLAGQILFWPVVLLSAVVDLRNLGAGLMVAMYLANSVVWAALAALLWSWYRRLRERALGVVRATALERRGAA
jgi:uncharacterized membrane protein YbhN (UPF0104 family)